MTATDALTSRETIRRIADRANVQVATVIEFLGGWDCGLLSSCLYRAADEAGVDTATLPERSADAKAKHWRMR